MKLIFLYGPPAAGKLTVARELVRRTGYKLLHNHQTFDLLEPVFGAFHPAFGPLLNRLRLDVIRTAADANFDGLIVTHVYGPNEADFIRQLEDVVRERDGQAHFIQLLPRTDELERRAENVSRHEFNKIRSAADLRELMKNWDVTQKVPAASSLTIDNSELTPDQVADQIVRELGLTPPAPEAL